jgi:hypothetical protein
VIWKLWRTAGAHEELRKQMLSKQETRPTRGADLRVQRVAFRWVLNHLQGATSSWLSLGRDVILDALLERAKCSSQDWPPSFGGADSVEVDTQQHAGYSSIPKPGIKLPTRLTVSTTSKPNFPSAVPFNLSGSKRENRRLMTGAHLYPRRELATHYLPLLLDRPHMR